MRRTHTHTLMQKETDKPADANTHANTHAKRIINKVSDTCKCVPIKETNKRKIHVGGGVMERETDMSNAG